MSVISKLKKVKRSANRAEEKLLKLVRKQASKSKILKQVDSLIELKQKKRKLQRKAKTAEIVELPAEAIADLLTEETVTVESEVASENGLEEGKASNEYDATDARNKISDIVTLEALDTFIAGEERKSVLQRAQARKNVLMGES